MITIFSRPSYIARPKHLPDYTTHRISSRVRGEEIALYGKFKLNPFIGYEKDTLVYVKPTGITHIKDGDWVDVLDGLIFDRTELLKKRPLINIIAASQASFDDIKKRFPNKVILIPHHHINFNRDVRSKKEIDTCGYIGSPSIVANRIYDNIGQEVKKMGMKWEVCFNYKTREDAINFFKKIDILIIGAWELGDPNPYKLPTKIINAASFGIPSIAYPLSGYQEIKGYYRGIENMEDMKREIKRLTDKKYYSHLSSKVLEMSKSYHIKNIIKLYRQIQ